MAKKKNLYGKESISDLKFEIDSIISYLDTVNPEKTTDEMDFKITAKGIIPAIIATIEDSFKAALITIKDCVSMLLVISQLDDDAAYLATNHIRLKEKLAQIQLYYRKRPVMDIEHRRLTHSMGAGKPTVKNPNPPARTMSFLVATKQKQIADRAMITKRVLEIQPLLAELEEVTQALDVRGDYDLPESFLIRGII